jgi:hypothetical protein
MKPHEQRVVLEQQDLEEKIQKLDAFALTDVFKMLPVEDRCLLTKQASVMREYSAILIDRINRFVK